MYYPQNSQGTSYYFRAGTALMNGGISHEKDKILNERLLKNSSERQDWKNMMGCEFMRVPAFGAFQPKCQRGCAN